jgi:hypothetical protein
VGLYCPWTGVFSTAKLPSDSYRPIAKAVPEIPSGDPILLVDVVVSAELIVVLRVWRGIVDDRQDFSVLRSLGNLVPLVWCSRRVLLGLIGQVEWISTQGVPCGLGLLLTTQTMSVSCL